MNRAFVRPGASSRSQPLGAMSPPSPPRVNELSKWPPRLKLHTYCSINTAAAAVWLISAAG